MRYSWNAVHNLRNLSRKGKAEVKTKMKRGIFISVFFLVLCAVSFPGTAGIIYDREEKTVYVRLFSEAWPCTPALLFSRSEKAGWGIVNHDPETDTYRLEASLVIGSNDGTDTYFQIGGKDKDRLREILVVNGDVKVHPYYVEGENEGRWYTARRSVNRLTIGMEDDPSVQASLKIASGPDREHTLQIGYGQGGFGGQLMVYNGTITAAIQDKEHMIAADAGDNRMLMRGDRIVLKTAALSWIDGPMTFAAANQGTAKVFICENAVFEHGGTALTDAGPTVISGCTFRNLQTAIQDRGGLDLVLVDCTFENNRRNWGLVYTGKGVTLINCRFDDPLRYGVYRAWLNPQTKEMQYPLFTSRRNVVVEVVDVSGQTVAGASVEVTCEQAELDAVDNGRHTADAAGRTPDKGKEKAVLLTEMIIRGMENIKEPEVRNFSYTVKAGTADGRAGTVSRFTPNESWQTIRVVVK